MQAIKVLYGHELADLVNEEQLFEAADLNNISITEALVPGVTLTIPDVASPNVQKERLQPAALVTSTRSLPGQTWVDMTLQMLGDEERLFDLCDLNNVGITDDLTAGAFITATDFDSDKRQIVNTLEVTKPASKESLTSAGGEVVEEGIEFWAIEFDFVVS